MRLTVPKNDSARAQTLATNAVLSSDTFPSNFVPHLLVPCNITITARMDSNLLPDISKMAITTPPPVPDGHECASCHGHGNMACKGCLLVVYCGRDCQAAHWKEHKKYCKSPIMKENWQPGWVTERRTPTFVGDDWIIGSTIRKKYFWGNLPALDVIQLASNEGLTYKNGLQLLFAGKFIWDHLFFNHC